MVFLYLERLLRFIFVLLVLLLFSTAEAPPLFRSGPPGPGEVSVVWNHNKQGQEWCVPVPAWAGGGTGEICTSDRDASSVLLTFILPPRSPTPLSPPWSGSPGVPSSLTSLPVFSTSHTQSASSTWKVRAVLFYRAGFALRSVCQVQPELIQTVQEAA